jgi:glutathione S-transferase
MKHLSGRPTQQSERRNYPPLPLFSPEAMRTAYGRAEAALKQLESKLELRTGAWLFGEMVTMADVFWIIELLRIEYGHGVVLGSGPSSAGRRLCRRWRRFAFSPRGDHRVAVWDVLIALSHSIASLPRPV